MLASSRSAMLVLLLLALLAGGIFFSMQHFSLLKKQTVQIGATTIPVEVASTEAARQLGLSGRASLFEGQGMLFVFEQDGAYGFWMKDMQFSIDIIWADASGKIITIDKNVSPATYPKAFYPSAPARYVLELPAGFADRHRIAEGMKIVI